MKLNYPNVGRILCKTRKSDMKFILINQGYQVRYLVCFSNLVQLLEEVELV